MELVTIKMKRTARGSEFGWDVSTFAEGKVYATSAALAKVFVEQLQVADYYDDSSTQEAETTPAVEMVRKRSKSRR